MASPLMGRNIEYEPLFYVIFFVYQIKCFCAAHDSSRVAVGCSDQRVYVYSIHTAQLLRTLAVAHDLAALAVADKDHFLLAAGRFYFFL